MREGHDQAVASASPPGLGTRKPQSSCRDRLHDGGSNGHHGKPGQSTGCHGPADVLLRHAGEQCPSADKVRGTSRDQQLIISALCSAFFSTTMTMALNAMMPCKACHRGS